MKRVSSAESYRSSFTLVVLVKLTRTEASWEEAVSEESLKNTKWPLSVRSGAKETTRASWPLTVKNTNFSFYVNKTLINNPFLNEVKVKQSTLYVKVGR